MYPNLRAEMARLGIKPSDIATTLDICYKSTLQKLNGETPFTLDEAQKIREKHFNFVSMDILFNKD